MHVADGRPAIQNKEVKAETTQKSLNSDTIPLIVPINQSFEMPYVVRNFNQPRDVQMTYSNNYKTLQTLPEADDTLLSRSEVPKYLPIQSQTLARWATEGIGPPFVKLGRRLVAYRSGDLRNWLRQNIRTNTIVETGSHD